MNITVLILVCVMSSLGICLSFLFLFFNVRNRRKRYVQQNNTLNNFPREKHSVTSPKHLIIPLAHARGLFLVRTPRWGLHVHCGDSGVVVGILE